MKQTKTTLNIQKLNLLQYLYGHISQRKKKINLREKLK